eukprot:TRINITY_DN15173_c0_g1_i1.p1 TRINITY_DN15173_c0_g1~~TRINITY_DN15173_c0_g1_i1.p1  ORF type:complete len:557 (+),score=139.93 TRINITY_DN15173_c0_g1_i1:281-1951(+)
MNGPELSEVVHQRLKKIKARESEKTPPTYDNPQKYPRYKGKAKLTAPYAFQVGGHDAIWKVSQGKICKPLCKRELWFFDHVQKQNQVMLRVLPRFYGCVSVSKAELEALVQEALEEHNPRLHKRNSRNISPGQSSSSSSGSTTPHFVSSSLTNECLPGAPEPLSPSSSRTSSDYFSLSPLDPSIESSSSALESFSAAQGPPRPASATPSVSLPIATSSAGTHLKHSTSAPDLSPKDDPNHPLNNWNPWSRQMHQARLLTMKEFDEPEYYFIVLQDLTYGYKHPCVLDLKMGTRQHGDDVTETKRLSAIKKCNESTSSTLGFRMCGTQIWQPKTRTFRNIDKYQGRKLDHDQLKGAMRNFFHNGQRVRLELIRPFIRKVRRLIDLIQSQGDSKYRFYSTSLLLIFEGSTSALPAYQNSDLREFAGLPPRPKEEHEERRRSDTGDRSSSDDECDDDEDHDDIDENDLESLPVTNDMDVDQTEQDSPQLSSIGIKDDDNAERVRRQGELFKVRMKMIDFAHTFPEDDAKVDDSGFIHGLQNVIKTLEGVLESEIESMGL